MQGLYKFAVRPDNGAGQFIGPRSAAMFHFAKPQPRYRLRTLLVGVTLTCFLLTAAPFEARQYHQRKGRARQHIVSLGGTVETAGYINRPSPGTNWLSEKLGYTEPRESLWNVTLAGASLSVNDVERLSRCDWIVVLNLSNTNFGDDALDHVARLTNLRGLKLANTQVTDAGLMKLKSLSQLRLLGVVGTAASYDGLAKLERANPDTNFQEQLAISRVRARGIVVDSGSYLSHPGTRDSLQSTIAGVKSELDLQIFMGSMEPDRAGSIHFTQPVKLAKQEIGDLRRLVSLRAWNSTGVTFPNGGLKFLTALSNLVSVTIDDAATGNLTDDDLRWLAKLPRLESLELHGRNLTDAGIRHLAASPQLTSLSLAGNGFTDAGFAHLSDMHQLQTLSVHGNRLTPSLLYHLRGLTGLRRLELNLWHRGSGADPYGRPPEEVIAAARESMTYHADIPHLEQLSIRGNLMVAEVLLPLTQLASLVWLQVDGRFVSHEEARALQEAMPHCHVQRVDFD